MTGGIIGSPLLDDRIIHSHESERILNWLDHNTAKVVFIGMALDIVDITLMAGIRLAGICIFRDISTGEAFV